MDKNLVKKSKKILFVKITNDGFGLGAQRREVIGSGLPLALDVVTRFQNCIKESKDCELTELEKRHALILDKKDINDDNNLSADRYIKEDVYSGKWGLVELGEVCELETGSRDKGGALSNGIPSIGGEQISEHGNIRQDKMKYISEEHFKQMKKGILQDNDVLMVKDGATTGKMGFYKRIYEQAAINEHVYILRAKENTYPLYLFNVLKAEDFQNRLQKYIQGIIGGISQEIRLIKIPLPPLEIQEQIVSELKSYQNIIDGAKKVVESYKPSFKIEKEWEVVELGDVCKPEYGYSEISKDEGKYRYIRITDIDESGLIKNEDYKYVDLNEKSKNYILKKGDVVVAITGATYGKTAYFDKDYPSIFAGYLIRLNFKPSIISKFYWIFSRSLDYEKQKQKLVQGGGQPQFNANVIVKIKIPLPPLEIQNQIVSQIQEEQALVDSNKKLIELFEKKIKIKIAEVWGE
jgi:type I restriction enzyme M protein